MIYDFDEIVNRKGTNSLKWEFPHFGVKGADYETLPLWVADMDFPCAQPILDAVHKRVDRQIFGYSVAYTKEYTDAVSLWFRRRFDWDISNEEIVVCPGVVPAIGFLIRMLTQAGEGVIIQRPVYYPFTNMIVNNKRKVVNNSLVNVDGHYSINFDDLEEKAKDPNNTLMLFCSPHNPVGRVWSKEELERVGQICLENNVILVSDEIHCDLVRKGVKHIPISSLFESDRIITCTAPSKTFNMAGLQVSNIIIKNNEFREKWQKEVFDTIGIYGINSIGISATEAAYNEGEEWLGQVTAYIDKNLEYVKSFIDKHLSKAKFDIPMGTYFAWIDLRDYGYKYVELKELMVKKAKVALDEGYIFGEEGNGFERINVACPQSILKECLQRMKTALENKI